MRTNLEDDLTRTFRAAGLAAPGAEAGFPAALAARRRRRARTRRAGIAAALTAVVAVVAAGLPAALRPDPAPPQGAPPTGSWPSVDLSAAKPYRELWPDALVELPLRLPDGRRYAVQAALGGDAYLVVPRDERGFLAPVVLDARTGDARGLGPEAGGTVYGQGTVYLTESHIAWVVTTRGSGGTGYREVWSVARDGGVAVRRARFGPDDMNVVVAEVGGVFYASVEPSTGVSAVFRIPDGGEPEKVAGSEGYTLRNGPWAALRPAGPRDVRPWDRAAPAAAPEFWNVATGERRTPPVLDGVALIGCTPWVCVGRDGQSLVSYGVDGDRPLRATGGVAHPAGIDTVYFDSTGRFIQLRLGSGVYLWDRATNTAGLQQDGSSGDGDVIDVGQPGGKQHLLVLARVR